MTDLEIAQNVGPKGIPQSKAKLQSKINNSLKMDIKRWMKILTHVIVILMLFVLPEIIFNYSRPPWKTAPVASYTIYLKAFVYVLVFYANYYIILSKTILNTKRRVWPFVVWNLLFIGLALYALYFLQDLSFVPKPKPLPELGRPKPPIPFRNLSFLTREAVMLILIIALSVALRLGEKWSSIEKHHANMLASQKSDELASLKNQLNPHFLFNTLNTIYALIDINANQAKNAVHQLSSLLRYVLYENPTFVELGQEINFAKNYISLMEMRMGANPIKADFHNCIRSNLEVPPLIFISLIENAFKHGNTGQKDQPIDISIYVDEEGTVICKTSNYFIPKIHIEETDNKTEAHAGGIGITNLKRRLQLLYGNKAKLEISIHNNRYLTTLIIPTDSKSN